MTNTWTMMRTKATHKDEDEDSNRCDCQRIFREDLLATPPSVRSSNEHGFATLRPPWCRGAPASPQPLCWGGFTDCSAGLSPDPGCLAIANCHAIAALTATTAPSPSYRANYQPCNYDCNRCQVNRTPVSDNAVAPAQPCLLTKPDIGPLGQTAKPTPIRNQALEEEAASEAATPGSKSCSNFASRPAGKLAIPLSCKLARKEVTASRRSRTGIFGNCTITFHTA